MTHWVHMAMGRSRRLAAFAADELLPADRLQVEGELVRCPACRREVEAYRLVSRMLHTSPRAVLTPEEASAFWPGVQTRIRQGTAARGMIEVLLQKGLHEEQDTPVVIDLNGLLEEELSVMNHNLFFKHQIDLKKRLAPRLPTVRGYYVDLSQGLLNLIQNGLEAMEQVLAVL